MNQIPKLIFRSSIAESVGPLRTRQRATDKASMCYSANKPADNRPPVAAGGGQPFQQQAGERRRRASSLQLASPPVATRNGLACLLLEYPHFDPQILLQSHI